MLRDFLSFKTLDLPARITRITIVLLSIYLFILAIFSLKWSILLDSPIMLYISFAMKNFDLIPYRDIFDFNMPGIYFFNWIYISIFGTGDLGFRIGDLLYLGAIMITTQLLMKKFGYTMAWMASIIFGVAYLMNGPTVSMQREFVILLPIAVALYISTASIKLNDSIRYALVGLMFGMVAAIRPHGALGFPVILIYMIKDSQDSNRSGSFKKLSIIRLILYSLIGFIIPLAACWIYLIITNSLSDFLDIARNYWPLYGHLTGGHETIWGVEKSLYLIRGFLNFGDYTLWFIPAAIGIYMSLNSSGLSSLLKRQVVLLIGLAVIYAIYPIFAGKFWPYHWLPMLYFAILLSSLCFAGERNQSSKFGRLFPIIIFLMALIPGIRPSDDMLHNLIVPDNRPKNVDFMENYRAIEIATFLKENADKNDLVQPLDWTGGAVHAILISKLKIATPFIYDFYFYHNISSPYIQHLRSRFINNLKDVRPKFIIQISTKKPWPYGFDTNQEFEELTDFIETAYQPVSKGIGYTIYSRK